jgi:hypothetical protein
MLKVNKGLVRPQSGAQLLSVYDFSLVLQQQAKHLQRLLLEAHSKAVGCPQVTAAQIDLETVKANTHRGCARRSHSNTPPVSGELYLNLKSGIEITLEADHDVLPGYSANLHICIEFPASSFRYLTCYLPSIARHRWECDGAA